MLHFGTAQRDHGWKNKIEGVAVRQVEAGDEEIERHRVEHRPRALDPADEEDSGLRENAFHRGTERFAADEIGLEDQNPLHGAGQGPD